jgi:hypothetical protein
MLGQETGPQSNLVFGVAGSFSTNTSLWNVPNQPEGFVADTFNLTRNLDSGLGLMFYGMYYPGKTFGLTGEVFFVGNGYQDHCEPVAPIVDQNNAIACQDISGQTRSTSTVTMTVGGIMRFNPRSTISPFLRAALGVAIVNRNSIAMQGNSPGGIKIIYPGNDTRGLNGAVVLGAGFTARSKNGGYQVRLEARDNIIGYDAATGPSPKFEVDPPTEVRYRNVFTFLIGFEIVLEKSRGRRY